MNLNFVQPFGYAEMFELTDSKQYAYGRFVGFDNDNPEKIVWTNDLNNLIGVTSVNFAYLSNLYKEWPNKYVYDQYGDIYLKNDVQAAGILDYDDVNEISYIRTYRKQEYTPLISKEFNEQLHYIPRNSRPEWIPVVLLGRCIVEDDGTCIPGKYCFLYEGPDQKLYGTVTSKVSEINRLKPWRVLKRISKNTIMILFK